MDHYFLDIQYHGFTCAATKVVETANNTTATANILGLFIRSYPDI